MSFYFRCILHQLIEFVCSSDDRRTLINIRTASMLYQNRQYPMNDSSNRTDYEICNDLQDECKCWLWRCGWYVACRGKTQSPRVRRHSASLQPQLGGILRHCRCTRLFVRFHGVCLADWLLFVALLPSCESILKCFHFYFEFLNVYSKSDFIIFIILNWKFCRALIRLQNCI